MTGATLSYEAIRYQHHRYTEAPIFEAAFRDLLHYYESYYALLMSIERLDILREIDFEAGCIRQCK